MAGAVGFEPTIPTPIGALPLGTLIKLDTI